MYQNEYLAKEKTQGFAIHTAHHNNLKCIALYLYGQEGISFGMALRVKFSKIVIPRIYRRNVYLKLYYSRGLMIGRRRLAHYNGREREREDRAKNPPFVQHFRYI